MTDRARTFAELTAIRQDLIRPDEVAKALAFVPRPSDVIIAPFAKCGTTWLQQIFHTLRTGGDEDYDDISRVVPWIETSIPLGLDLDAEQVASPRGFKSHLGWQPVPKGCRYVVALRDPCDAAVSFYHFMSGWLMERGAMSVDAFVLADTIPQAQDPAQRSYWHHLLGWWGARHEEAVLLLSYEDMRRRPERTVRRVARHCGIELGDALLALTLEHSSIDYMKRNQDKFDDRLMRDLTETRCGLPPGAESSKVREGRAGDHRSELGADVIARMDRVWRELVEPETGFASYAELESALVAEGDASSR